ncbi:Holliday junction branch migration protein RuvA [Oceanidesulfovibrio indonesiensis]|uniref:Holliday junction branch migration complex subunit RuvA n=1 Tax=Oceanidesulfovibrio indonesiensis TaxID=54767 RepID=A0A7M3MJ45_9BACT|nr:Holliday junction branch migration protein RuvA [Oceanidesulfovibrio indonesiensis]TVM19814.1 Holliday junction branch migration protein RuvA [Oceanidesulfovibrio indonesiensis]
MIAYLEGRLLDTSENSLVIVTEGGVGYELYAPVPLLSRLPARGEHLNMHVQTIVREDAIELYGFEDRESRKLFALLISISKLGPKTGLAILSMFSPDDLRRIVADEDVTALTRVPGIGKKTGQHIFLELKYKLKDTVGDLHPTGPVGSVLRDAVAGLVNLGYSEEEARSAVEESLAEDDELDVAEALRAALKRLAAKR